MKYSLSRTLVRCELGETPTWLHLPPNATILGIHRKNDVHVEVFVLVPHEPDPEPSEEDGAE